ncbi:MAG: hypothetical protein E7461_03430 [Ruminococcaceae bacterium]|nr:hypothetical protein [Oscillospiraceae bacterium]
MMKRKVFCILLILCLLATSLAGCGGVGDIQLPMGHRYGNPEVTYADGKATVKYICVDCDFTETEIRTVSTQVADAAAWSEAFGKLNKSNYSLFMEKTEDEKVTETQHCAVTEDRGYFAYTEQGVYEYDFVYYTLKKNDESFLTYAINYEEDTCLARETDDSYYLQMKKVSSLFLDLGDKFDQFTYDAESGSYVSTAPIEVEVFGYEGESLFATPFESISVIIADGNVCAIHAKYSVLNDLLEKMQIEFRIYNMGFTVVKVPQAIIDTVSNTTKDPADYFTYEIKNGTATVTAVDPAISGEVVIPFAVGECPVVAIGEGAFEGCTKLTGISIPGSVVSIGDNAFLGCDKLVKVAYAGTEEQWAEVTVGQTGNEPLLGATIQFNAECVHSYDAGTVTKEPTCGTAGIKTYTCTLCGSEKTEVMTATLGHSYDEGVIVENATCTDAGIKVYSCTVCGKNKTEYVPKLQTHSYTNGTCIHCGADDPQYAPDTGEEADGIWGAIVGLFKSLLEIIAFFK